MRFLDFMLRQTPAYGVFQVPGAQPTSLWCTTHKIWFKRSIPPTGFLWFATLQTRNRQVRCSNLSRDTFWMKFPLVFSVPPSNYRDSAPITPWQFLSKSSSIHLSTFYQRYTI
jgi:hypothetical protein